MRVTDGWTFPVPWSKRVVKHIWKKTAKHKWYCDRAIEANDVLWAGLVFYNYVEDI
jgi:hypothetical protein